MGQFSDTVSRYLIDKLSKRRGEKSVMEGFQPPPAGAPSLAPLAAPMVPVPPAAVPEPAPQRPVMARRPAPAAPEVDPLADILTGPVKALPGAPLDMSAPAQPTPDAPTPDDSRGTDEAKVAERRAIVSGHMKPERPSEQDGFAGAVGKALGGLADAGVARAGSKSSFLSDINAQDAQANADILANRTAMRADKVEGRAETEFAQKQAAERDLDDPNSPRAAALRAVASKVFPSGDFSKMTPRQLESALTPYLKLYDIDSDEKTRAEAIRQREDAARERNADRDEAHSARVDKNNEDRTSKMNQEITSNPAYTNWSKVKQAKDFIAQAAANPSAMGDIGTVYSYISALDPSSAVREGEIHLLGVASSVRTRLESAVNRMAKGQTLTPEQRKDIESWVDVKERASRSILKQTAAGKVAQAKRLGLNVAEIDPLYGIDDAPPAGAAPAGGGKIKVSNGKETLMIDPADERDAAADGFKRVP